MKLGFFTMPIHPPRTLLNAGKDWRGREFGRRVMILMAGQVMPHVNAGCARSRDAAG